MHVINHQDKIGFRSQSNLWMLRLFSYRKTLLISHTGPLIPFIYTTVSLCPCVTFRVSQLPAVIFSATYWDEVAVQHSGGLVGWKKKNPLHSASFAPERRTAPREVSDRKWDDCVKRAVGVRQRDYHNDLFWLDSTARRSFRPVKFNLAKTSFTPFTG